MLADYFYWQYVWGPRWLLRLFVTLQRALVQLFSVPLMLRTLVAHWHKDSMPFRGGTLSELGMSVIWNLISRAAGFTIRSIILIIWLTAEVIFISTALAVFLFFLLWPYLVVIGLSVSLTLFTVGAFGL